ncbi:hypothetical protein DL96DRAFT_1685741 [Flagelloscypha sp. PMI_526]|nr:hypothetical protein DL96DRAFT_1685741 [Flagelloscypha sp. PMI_526]
MSHDAWEAVYLKSYLRCVGTSILLWDHSITFDEEVRLIWLDRSRKKTTPGTILFILNRYGSLVFNLGIFVGEWLEIPPERCELFEILRNIALILIAYFAIGNMMLRVYVACGYHHFSPPIYPSRYVAFLSNRRMLIFLISLLSVLTILGIIIYLPAGTKDQAPNIPYCFFAMGNASRARTAAPMEMICALDLVLFGLLAWKTFDTRQRFHGLSPQLLLVLAQHGALYFLIMTLINMANTFTFYLGGEYVWGSLGTVASSVAPVLVSRMTLNLLSYGQQERTQNSESFSGVEHGRRRSEGEDILMQTLTVPA